MSKNKDKFTVKNNDIGTDRKMEIKDGERVGRTNSPLSKPKFLFFDDKPFSEDQINID